jgi:hypothetical protein
MDRTYDDWLTDIGPWPSIDDDQRPRRSVWSVLRAKRTMRAIDEPVLDLTEDEAGGVPESILDLTGDVPEASPDVIDHANDNPVLDLTEDGPHLAFPDLHDTPVPTVDGDTRAFVFRVYDRLTSDEQASLVREAAAGDRLAQHLRAVLDAAGVADVSRIRDRGTAGR